MGISPDWVRQTVGRARGLRGRTSGDAIVCSGINISQAMASPDNLTKTRIVILVPALAW